MPKSRQICPACAYAYAEDDSGLCRACEVRRVTRKYAAESDRVIEARREQWRERRRRHRLWSRLRPTEVGDDPLDEGIAALDLIAKLRRGLRSARSHALADELEECVRRLAWGGENDENGDANR